MYLGQLVYDLPCLDWENGYVIVKDQDGFKPITQFGHFAWYAVAPFNSTYSTVFMRFKDLFNRGGYAVFTRRLAVICLINWLGERNLDHGFYPYS